MSGAMNSVWLVVIGAAMTALGLWMLIGSIRDVQLGRRSHAWPTVPGHVTEGKIVRGKTDRYKIRYDYEVEGLSFEGKVVQAHNGDQARDLQTRYPVGIDVDVHYDPARPAKSVLIPGVGSGAKWAFIGAAMLLSFGLYLLGTWVARSLPPRTPASPQVDLSINGLTEPTCVAVDAAGNVYVCDAVAKETPIAIGPATTTTPRPAIPASPSALSGGRLIRVPATTSFPRVLTRPSGAAVDSSGAIIVTDTKCVGSAISLGCLWVFKDESDGRTTGAQTLSLPWPGGVAVDSEDTVYIAAAGKVLQLAAGSSKATTLFEVPDKGTASDVAVDGANNVYITDRLKNRVLKLATGGTASTELPFTGLSQPDGVAVDPAGNVYVVDSGNNRVLKLAIGSTTPTELPFSGLKTPGDVAVDAAGNVYVTDQGNRRVLKMPVR